MDLVGHLQGVSDVGALRKASKQFQASSDIQQLLASLRDMDAHYGADGSGEGGELVKSPLTREDLRLTCFDLVTS